MRRYLNDTTPLAAYLQDRPNAVTLLRPWLRHQEAATSILVYGEIVEHLRRLPTFAQDERQFRFLSQSIFL